VFSACAHPADDVFIRRNTVQKVRDCCYLLIFILVGLILLFSGGFFFSVFISSTSRFVYTPPRNRPGVFSSEKERERVRKSSQCGL
jgi:hypothetical protein